MNEVIWDYSCWDNELEFVAEEFAKTCRLDYNYCSSTTSYPNAGKIISVRVYNSFLSFKDFLNEIFHAWFTQYMNVPVSIIQSYKNEIIRKTRNDFDDFEITCWKLLSLRNWSRMMSVKWVVPCIIVGKGIGNFNISWHVLNKPLYHEGVKPGQNCTAIIKEFCCSCYTPLPGNLSAKEEQDEYEGPHIDLELATFQGARINQRTMVLCYV